MSQVDLRSEHPNRYAAAPSPNPASTLVSAAVLVALIPAWLLLVLLIGGALVPTVLVLVSLVLVLLNDRRHRQAGRGPARPQLGGEKQLLLALRDLGGLTAVEAALETSLSVDEAEGILTRLAERGHLRLEGRGGTLIYALPEHRYDHPDDGTMRRGLGDRGGSDHGPRRSR